MLEDKGESIYQLSVVRWVSRVLTKHLIRRRGRAREGHGPHNLSA